MEDSRVELEVDKKQHRRHRTAVYNDGQEIKFNPEKMKYLVYQQEICPTTGKLHLQVYVEWKHPVYYPTVYKMFNVQYCKFFKCAASSEANKKYCTKKETRREGPPEIVGPFEYGEMSTPGKRTDLHAFAEYLKTGPDRADIIEKHCDMALRYVKNIDWVLQNRERAQPRPKPQVWYIWGEPRIGKSLWWKRHFPDAHLKFEHGDRFFLDYNGEDTIIFDEFQGAYDRSTMMQLIDSTKITVPVKGGHVPMKAYRFVFTSNFPPESWYSDTDAWMGRLRDFGVFVGRVTREMLAADEIPLIPKDTSRESAGLAANHCKPTPVISPRWWENGALKPVYTFTMPQEPLSPLSYDPCHGRTSGDELGETGGVVSGRTT